MLTNPGNPVRLHAPTARPLIPITLRIPSTRPLVAGTALCG